MHQSKSPARLHRIAFSMIATLSTFASISVISHAQPLPLKAVPGDLVTDYFGMKVADPYRALEDRTSPTTQEWAKGNADYTRAQLDQLPGLKAMRERINALDADQSPLIRRLQVTPRGQWLYLKRMPGANFTKLYIRDSVAGKERLLLDPEVLKKTTGSNYSINNFTASPNGDFIATVIAKADAELGELQIISTKTGKQVLPAVPRIWGETLALWNRDGKSLVYIQQPPAENVDTPFGKMQIYVRKLDGSPDQKLMGFGATFGPEIRAKDWVYVEPASSPKYTVAAVAEGIGSNGRVLFALTADVAEDPTTTQWRELFGVDADVRGGGAHGHYFYTRTFKGASRYRIMRYDLDNPAAPAIEVAAQQKGVIDDMTIAADGVYFVVREGSVTDLYRLRHTDKPTPPEKVALPFVGAVTMFDADPNVAGLVFRLEGWTRESQMYRIDAKPSGINVIAASIVPVSTSKVGQDWVAEESTCVSHDGVEVPMSIIYKRGLVKDGSHSTLINGYGGYGYAEPTYFNRKLDPWLQRGGIYVDVKPRGGGAYGRDWYQAGVGATKANTWKDMIACGQTLVQRGYTSPQKLAIEGTSMGGVAVGRAITERPDLFAAALVRVGITDTLRFIEASSNGPNHESEMGSAKTAEGVKQLLAMSTYHNIKAGEKYPAVLFTAGVNDNRVAPWIVYKSFARMAAATGSGKPVLMHVEFEGGHGVTTTASQRNAELADQFAFVLWNTGAADFQPVAAPK